MKNVAKELIEKHHHENNVVFLYLQNQEILHLYPKKEKETVLKFIEDELKFYCQNGLFIEDQIGYGAKKV